MQGGTFGAPFPRSHQKGAKKGKQEEKGKGKKRKRWKEKKKERYGKKKKEWHHSCASEAQGRKL